MSSYEPIYEKMAAALEQGGAGNLRKPAQKFDPARHISPIIAHELNNVLTIVQGYSERLLIRHGEEPTLQQQLKLISEAAKRATTIVREATPPNANAMFRQHHNSQPLQPVA
jgi:signal transduction histidine kinase